MHFTIPLFERRTPHGFECATLGLGPLSCSREGTNLHRVQRKLLDFLRPAFEKLPAADLARVEMPRGMRLEKVRLELTLGGADRRKVTGVFPIVLEPRWASDDAKITLAYHPARQDEAAPVREDLPLAEQVRALFQKTWAGLRDHEIEALYCRGRERINALGFTCSPRSALDDLPRRRDEDGGADPAFQRRRRRAMRVLPELGVNLTSRAAQGDLDLGVPRSPFREQLALLLGASRAQPVIVVGPPGCGKSMLIQRAVRDLLEADGYSTHRNFDRVRHCWQLSGRRLIAGMSRLGEWEKRCVELLEDAHDRDLVLVVDDLHHFGRIGQSRDSERSLADFFRGPLLRRELTIVGECTPEALRHLEQETPSFAALFTQLHLPESTRAETLRLMLREARALEQRHPVALNPHALRAILDVGGALLSSRALPGKAMDLLRELCAAPGEPRLDPGKRGEAPARRPVGAPEVLRLLSGKTGVPEPLIHQGTAVDPAHIEEELARQVIGQPAAVQAAADLVARVKAGLTDPRRPYAVYLFTGPTGTGKTELAKCLAELLYGSPSRLLRFDMSELSGPDAPARLIGDRWDPDGLLTQRAQEQPFSLILLDEIEKAHRSVHALLLQLFEDGRLTDAAGRTARFNHAVIVMTSNLGARTRSPLGFGEGGSGARSAAAADERMKEIAAAVRDFFPPELFNRIDRIVPFRPLTPEVAVRVTEKELGKLLRRRGLAERNIFVTAAAGVAERLSDVAFSAQDGARSVKRAIEDRIGGLLSDAIAGGTPAAMQILRIRTQGEAFAIDREALSEAPPAAARWAIEPLLGRPLAALAGELAALSARAAALADGDELAHLSERIRHHLREHRLAAGGEAGAEALEHAEAVFNLDAMRAAVHAFHAQVESFRQRIEGDVEAEHLALEVQRFGYQVRSDEYSRSRVRLFHRSQLGQIERAPTRQEALEAIADGYALRRALQKVDEPGQHAIHIELLRAGALDEGRRFSGKTGEGLLEALARAYVGGRGMLEDWAALRPDGQVLTASEEALHEALDGGAELIVLGMVGLCMLDFYELEQGTHVWMSLGRGPELVRVRVLPARPGVKAAAAVEEHRARRAAFDEATRRGGELPENPAALLPVVRTIRFDPPQQPGRTAPMEIEDYVMGYAETVEARTVGQGLLPLWLLRMSREELG